MLYRRILPSILTQTSPQCNAATYLSLCPVTSRDEPLLSLDPAPFQRHLLPGGRRAFASSVPGEDIEDIKAAASILSTTAVLQFREASVGRLVLHGWGPTRFVDACFDPLFPSQELKHIAETRPAITLPEFERVAKTYGIASSEVRIVRPTTGASASLGRREALHIQQVEGLLYSHSDALPSRERRWSCCA